MGRSERIKDVKSDSTLDERAGADARVAPLRARFPEDLRTWLKGSALLRLANGVAQEHTAGALQPVFSMNARRFHHPWRMLTLLGYALASGIWHPRAIAEMASLDPSLVALFHGEAPSPEMIRRFRNQNRLPVLRCLEQILRRLWCHQHDQRVALVPPLLTVEILCDARARLQRAERSERSEGADRHLNFQGG